MQYFHKLDIWNKAHHLVLRVYAVSQDLPKTENFGLTLNLRRSATFIPQRIAEGAGKSSDADFGADLKRARAAAYELEYLVLLCRDLGFVSSEIYDELAVNIAEVRRMISGLVNRISAATETVR
jgi:four helix bundle protein